MRHAGNAPRKREQQRDSSRADGEFASHDIASQQRDWPLPFDTKSSKLTSNGTDASCTPSNSDADPAASSCTTTSSADSADRVSGPATDGPHEHELASPIHSTIPHPAIDALAPDFCLAA
jgi:hypothetical protein